MRVCVRACVRVYVRVWSVCVRACVECAHYNHTSGCMRVVRFAKVAKVATILKRTVWLFSAEA